MCFITTKNVWARRICIPFHRFYSSIDLCVFLSYTLCLSLVRLLYLNHESSGDEHNCV